MMTTDIFIPKPGHGVVYGLFDYAEPLQIRYVGQTQCSGKTRLVQHEAHAKKDAPKNRRKNAWINSVWTSGSRVGIRLLGEYPVSGLNSAERKWIEFWGAYCDLLNLSRGGGASSRPAKRHKPRLRSTDEILQDVSKLLEDPANRDTICRAVELLKPQA